eukprot:sb/3462101/
MSRKKADQIFSKNLTGWERANKRSCDTTNNFLDLPYSTTVELRNEIEITGEVTHVDGAMNINMKWVTYKIPYKPEQKFETMHIHGKQIRFVHIPDEINMQKAIADQLKTYIHPKKQERREPRYLGKKREERERIMAEHAAKQAAAGGAGMRGPLVLQVRMLQQPMRNAILARCLSTTSSSGPLSGVKVVDMSRILAAPFATQNLADLGADVIKVERLGVGDDTRTWGPPFITPSLSNYFASCNRNKRSIAVNYTTPRGREVVTRLAKMSDVFVENGRPGTLSKHKLDYPSLREVNPRLIYASLSGYGQTGPDKSAYDLTIAAEGGLMGITGPEEGQPVKVGVAITDICAGLYLLSSVSAALFDRERNGGHGTFLDISIGGCQQRSAVLGVERGGGMAGARSSSAASSNAAAAVASISRPTGAAATATSSRLSGAASISRPSGAAVVSSSRLTAPFATQNLADLGADVIKVERLGVGDDTRTWGPPFITPSLSNYFASCNRNKRSIAVNYTTPRGREVVTRLAKMSDVFVENGRPGTLSKHKLDYPSLKEVNPRLIYASLSGYGQTGPDKSAYDLTIAAEGGLMGITGPEEGQPVKVGVAITDICAGLYLLSSVSAALFDRERNGGHGTFLDISMYRVQLGCLVNIASNYLNSGLVGKPRGSSHPSIVPYQGFTTSDGFIVVAANNDQQFWELSEAVGWPWLASNPMFSTNELRVENRAALIGHLTERFEEEGTEYWVRLSEGYSFSISPANSVKEAFEGPGSEGMVMEEGGVRMVAHPVRWKGEDPAGYRAPPELGQHTREVLGELGYSEGQVMDMERDGVVQ